MFSIPYVHGSRWEKQHEGDVKTKFDITSAVNLESVSAHRRAGTPMESSKPHSQSASPQSSLGPLVVARIRIFSRLCSRYYTEYPFASARIRVQVRMRQMPGTPVPTATTLAQQWQGYGAPSHSDARRPAHTISLVECSVTYVKRQVSHVATLPCTAHVGGSCV